jgi:hypothetical protein
MRLLLATAALAAFAATPVLAQTYSGYAGVAYVDSKVDVGPFDVESDGVQFEASLAAATAEGLGFQFDGSLGIVERTADSDVETYSGTAHLFRRFGDFGVGGFLGAIETEGTTIRAAGLGAVSSVADQITVAGGFQVGDFDIDEVARSDFWGVNGEVRFFVSDDFRLDAGAGLLRQDDADVRVFSVGGEYRIPNSAISLFADYSHVNSEADLDADVVRLGARFSFGGSLRERDRTGPSFTGLKHLTALGAAGS